MKTAFAFLAVVLLSGCAALPRHLEQGWKPGTIAVLPFTNQSADVALEKFARLAMIEELKKQGFQVLDIDSVDASLDGLGVTEAGQLTALSPAELADAVGSESFLFGDILDAKRVLLGFYLQKKVQIEFKILDRKGRTMWEDERTSMNSSVTILPSAALATAAMQFLKSMSNDLVMKALNSHPLITHLRAVCSWSASTLPRP